MGDVSYEIVRCNCKVDDGDDYAIQFEFFLIMDNRSGLWCAVGLLTMHGVHTKY